MTDIRDPIPVRENQLLELTVDRYGRKGDGISIYNGFAVIVPDSKKGLSYRVVIKKICKTFAFSRIVCCIGDRSC